MSLFFVAVVLILIIGVVIALTGLFGRTRVNERGVETTGNLAAVQSALEQFASASGRLPCPANPALDTGDSDPFGASAACNSPTGTIPWRTIGLSRNQSLDAWGWKISYRVYTGAAGSLTQDNGASMVLCDTSTSNPIALGPGGICQTIAGNHSLASDYLSGKGLSLNDFGTVHSDVAYVLISHGASGYGAYTAVGNRKILPASPDELANTATGPFVARAASSPDTSPEAADHFDDVLAYRTLSDFVTRANLAARDWPEAASLPPTVGYTMSSATLNAALGTSVSPGDLGTNRITFGTGADRARVRGFEGGASTDLAFDPASGPEPDSLGIYGSGGVTFLSSARADKVRIDLNQDVNKLGIALADFGTTTSGGTTQVEQVQFVFSRGTGGALPVTVVKSACRADGGLATFSIDPGVDFERVEITPLTAVPSGTTQFGIADFQFCGPGAGNCLSALAAPGAACP